MPRRFIWNPNWGICGNTDRINTAKLRYLIANFLEVKTVGESSVAMAPDTRFAELQLQLQKKSLDSFELPAMTIGVIFPAASVSCRIVAEGS